MKALKISNNKLANLLKYIHQIVVSLSFFLSETFNTCEL